MIDVGFAIGGEVRPAGGILRNPVARKGAIADFIENLLHLRFRLRRHDARTSGVVAVFRRVGHRIAHVIQPTLIHQIDDQLQLVQTLEVRHLRLVSGFGERLEARLHQR